MLTKDLLKFSRRDSRIHPKYVKPQDKLIIEMANELVDLYRHHVGQSWRQLHEQIKGHSDSGDAVFQGFCKLLEDRCGFGASDEALEKQRWDWFELSRNLRCGAELTLEQFEQEFSKLVTQGFSVVQDQLYGDLPEFRSIQSFDSMSGEALIHRYNAAQIQGLLLRAQTIRIVIKDKDLLARRRLLQKLRFCRLLAEFEESEQGILILKISGPLAIFDQVQSYGMRVCQFFPYVLLMSHWEIEATVKIDEKFYDLKIDSERSISSHYKSFTGHVPEEFRAFMAAFNDLVPHERKDWMIEVSQENLNLGRQSYSFPDLTFRHKSGAVRHLELFHRWHEGELRSRIELLAKNPDVPLIIGISTELQKQEALQGLLDRSKQLGISIFSFRQFPTVKAILAQLPKVKV